MQKILLTGHRIGKLDGEVVEMLDEQAEALVKSGEAKYVTDEQIVFPEDFEDFIRWTHSSDCYYFFDLDTKQWYFVNTVLTGAIQRIDFKNSVVIGNTAKLYTFWVKDIKNKKMP